MIKAACVAGYLFAAGLLTMPGCWKAESRRDQQGEAQQLPAEVLQHPLVGKPAPEIVAEGLEGNPIKLSEQRGKVVLLSFWTHWCPPCKRLFPHEKALAKGFEGRPFALIGVHSDPDHEKALRVVDAFGLTWPSVFDPQSKVFNRYQGQAFPTLVAIDHKGVVRAYDVGAQSGHAMDAFLDNLIKDAEKERAK